MLEQLLNLVKQNAGEAIVSNPAIPNEHNDAAIEETGNSIMNGLQGILGSGGVKNVLAMFSGGGNSNAANGIIQSLSGGVIQSLMGKFGIDANQAGGIANSIVPSVINQLIHKTNDANDNSFDIQGIFNQLSGGKTAGTNIQGLVTKFAGSGLDKDGDGDVDIQDLSSMLSGGNQSNAGGGLLDTISGFLK